MKSQLVSERRRNDYADRRLTEFTARCRNSGLSVTPQRLAIIRALLSSAEHPSADAVYATVRREHPHISLATVHRTLDTLCEIGEARKVTLLHESARYDGNVMPHHHVVCVRCRRIRDIEIPEAERLIDGRERIGDFRVLGASVELQAVCAGCIRAESPAQQRVRTRARRPR
ncbi:MAG TPA: transcriptional repressor [Candidatus Dormibacteraeota bacterium]|nr:transcriptional repressor [Candidatus Dormibacteraeota bacterium]